MDLIIDPSIDFTLTKPPCPPTISAVVQPQSRIFFKTLQGMAPNMQKVKNQHLAICWAIDVTQISREGVLGRSDPALGKGLIGSLHVLRAAADQTPILTL